MSINYNFARRFEGRPIMAHCHDGRRYYGVVSRVTPESIYLRPMPNRGVPVSNDAIEKEITTAEEKGSYQMEVLETGIGYGYPGRGFYGRGFYGPGYGAWWWGAGVVLPLYVLLAISLFWW